MLAYDPDQRYTLDRIINHRWLKGETPTKDQIISEFSERYNIIVEEREMEAQRQLQAKQAMDGFSGP